MFSNQSWGITAGGGLIVGILVGLAIGTSDDTDERLMQRVKDMEATLSQMQADHSATSAAIGDVKSHSAAVQGDTRALSETVSTLSAQMERQIGAVRRDIEAAREADAVLGEGQAALGTQLDEIAAAVSPEAMKETMKAIHAERHKKRKKSKKHKHHDKKKSKAEDAPKAEAEAASTAETGVEATQPAPTAPANSEDGLSAGATAVIGDARLFAYRISEDTVVGLINGTQGISLKAGDEPAEIGGCKVSVTSITSGVATLDVGC
ncbi:MAG: hypothetical protein AAGC81_17880 [Pseudomonadota bacterium]